MKLFFFFIVFSLFISFSANANYFQTCHNNRSDQLDGSFIVCVNDNFQKVQELEGPLGLENCYNFGRDPVSGEYQMCVNNNFIKIMRTLGNVKLRHCRNNRQDPRQREQDTVSWFFTSCINGNFAVINFSYE
ncbi:MAG: hypothetical protein ISR65_19595 [Bacteriovoracaceae bacterium]|nr:hypothetical protein [Bacteriovoracaceae bacterium]